VRRQEHPALFPDLPSIHIRPALPGHLLIEYNGTNKSIYFRLRSTGETLTLNPNKYCVFQSSAAQKEKNQAVRPFGGENKNECPIAFSDRENQFFNHQTSKRRAKAWDFQNRLAARSTNT
jgi:hypothetical protein